MSCKAIIAAAALCALAACGGTSSPSAPTTPSTPANGTGVSIVNGASGLTNTAFNPNPINVTVGGTVTWTNDDSTSHTSSADDGSWNSGNIAPKAQFSRTFPTAGTFTYHCAIHPGMVGSVKVQ